MPEANTVDGARVTLWGGWSLALPQCYFERTPDGAWSAWGEDWAIDVQIMELGGTVDGRTIEAETLYAIQPGVHKIRGRGWVGSADVIIEQDNGRNVFRMTGRMCADNTIMSCWVSYVHGSQEPLARAVVESVSHSA